MVVYWEYAFAENFLLDGALLYLAAKCTRKKVRLWKVALAAGVGAAEAIVFPMLTLPVWSAYFIKFLGGALIALIAAPRGLKQGLITVGAFFAFTFAFGGILTAAYSFFGVEYAEGNGFLVERAPVALVLGGALVFTIVCAELIKQLQKVRRMQRHLYDCVLTAGKRTVCWRGFADSGNLLSFRGEPVCVVSAAAVFALFGKTPESVGRITLGTVNGKKDSPVFRADRLQIAGKTIPNVYLTVGDVGGKNFQILLHTALTEEHYETSEHLTGMVESGGER